MRIPSAFSISSKPAYATNAARKDNHALFLGVHVFVRFGGWRRQAYHHHRGSKRAMGILGPA